MCCSELVVMASPALLCLDLKLRRVSALSLPTSNASSRSLSLLPRARADSDYRRVWIQHDEKHAEVFQSILTGCRRRDSTMVELPSSKFLRVTDILGTEGNTYKKETTMMLH